MYETNGRPLRLRRTSKLGVLNNVAKIVLWRLLELPPPVRLALWLTLLMLVASLMGCAATSTPSDFTPRNPQMPPPSQSQPSQTYSSSAAADISSWRKSLTDMLGTR
jgi:hypothetical protein